MMKSCQKMGRRRRLEKSRIIERCSVDTICHGITKGPMANQPSSDSATSPLITLGGYDNAVAVITKLQAESRDRFRGGDLRQLAEQDAILNLAMMGAALAFQMDEEQEDASELEFPEEG